MGSCGLRTVELLVVDTVELWVVDTVVGRSGSGPVVLGLEVW